MIVRSGLVAVIELFVIQDPDGFRAHVKDFVGVIAVNIPIFIVENFLKIAQGDRHILSRITLLDRP
jgi:hypothetical protein